MDSPEKLDAIVLGLEDIRNNLQLLSSRDSLTGSDVTSCSDIGDDEEPLSHAEESAIEECLNDTEGSLSNVDLNIFEDISEDLLMHKTRKTKGQRSFERADKNFGRIGTDYDSSSLDEGEVGSKSSLVENSLNNPISTIGVAVKTNARAESNQTGNHTTRWNIQKAVRRRKKIMNEVNTYFDGFSLKNNKKIVRRKRRNSPPLKKDDKTHIYSFFSAMADLVSTLPEEYTIKAKQNVNIVLEEMVDKFKEWSKNGDPKNPKSDVKFDLLDYNLVQDKLAKLQKNKD